MKNLGANISVKKKKKFHKKSERRLNQGELKNPGARKYSGRTNSSRRKNRGVESPLFETSAKGRRVEENDEIPGRKVLKYRG